jgi:hypothetical protein
MIKIVAMARNTPVILDENDLPSPDTGAPHHTGREDQAFLGMVLKQS